MLIVTALEMVVLKRYVTKCADLFVHALIFCGSWVNMRIRNLKREKSSMKLEKKIAYERQENIS